MQFDFFTLSEAHYKQRYQVGEISYHTLSGALSVLGQFRNFCTEVRRMEPPLAESITKELLQQYKLFCLEKGNKQVKTKSLITIPLSAPAIDILRRYKGLNRRFVFGLIPENTNLDDDAALAKAIDYRNRSVRQVLNGVGRRSDFPFPLGMHVARHTFAVKALNSTRLNVHMISRLLGHSSYL